ncbi:hypothetical protein P4U05_20050 [Bacillus paranthracis]|uniref:hypothetical protein n=1 Tax=Bacillus paranthracis TaxID=2026186 RepID=UPI000200FB60|nr:hypothetical protein [Bacillus paranthracis]ADY23975.1 hypothetical protein YBT020_23735 [Bacillus thuringiensis serovar finitimus YBT-020]MRC73903.1 hypothetical protein [Bacillus thuringiensis]OTX77308.1 hypothetical protein BK722_01895 [Bacillus thuringiensis serovar finitimus]MCR6795878.1 hypothetical protein [Bacillus paranthracis]MEC3360627.1 hypothetical protein [Bacillus paranthracis]
MWVIFATFIPIIWYYFDLPAAAFVEYSCIAIIVISTIVNKNVKSVLFFLGTVLLFLVAVSISILFGAFAFLLVLFAAGILFDTSRKKEQKDKKNYGGGFNSNPIRQPIIRPANTGYGGYGGTYGHNNDYDVQNDQNNSGLAQINAMIQNSQRFDEEQKEQMRQVEERARFLRQQGGNEYEVDAADDILGRSPQQRDYEDEMHAARCFGCGEIERECRCCTCNDHPCMC